MLLTEFNWELHFSSNTASKIIQGCTCLFLFIYLCCTCRQIDNSVGLGKWWCLFTHQVYIDVSGISFCIKSLQNMWLVRFFFFICCSAFVVTFYFFGPSSWISQTDCWYIILLTKYWDLWFMYVSMLVMKTFIPENQESIKVIWNPFFLCVCQLSPSLCVVK